MKILLTISHKYGTSISATPAETLLAPTPMFLMVVGYSSAVKTGMTALEELMEHLATIAMDVTSHWTLLEKRFCMGRMMRQETPALIMVRASGHRRPIFSRIMMLRATPGISTAPEIT